MPRGKNTDEYRKVKKSYPDLSNAIAKDIDSVSERLLSEGLITDGQKDAAISGHATAKNRASTITGLLLSKVEQDTKYFQTIVSVLQQHTVTFGTVLEQMGVTIDDGQPREQEPSQAKGSDGGTVIDERPTIDELLLLKYTDKGKKEKLRIINEASHKWKDIANLICGAANVTAKLEDKYRDPNECLKQTFISYFIDKKPQRYTQDWRGLIELLDDIDLETLAENVKCALDTKI